jgi:hypothetical protein
MKLRRMRRAFAQYKRRKRAAHRAGSRLDRLIHMYLESQETK